MPLEIRNVSANVAVKIQTSVFSQETVNRFLKLQISFLNDTTTS